MEEEKSAIRQKPFTIMMNRVEITAIHPKPA